MPEKKLTNFFDTNPEEAPQEASEETINKPEATKNFFDTNPTESPAEPEVNPLNAQAGIDVDIDSEELQNKTFNLADKQTQEYTKTVESYKKLFKESTGVERVLLKLGVGAINIADELLLGIPEIILKNKGYNTGALLEAGDEEFPVTSYGTSIGASILPLIVTGGASLALKTPVIASKAPKLASTAKALSNLPHIQIPTKIFEYTSKKAGGKVLGTIAGGSVLGSAYGLIDGVTAQEGSGKGVVSSTLTGGLVGGALPVGLNGLFKLGAFTVGAGINVTKKVSSSISKLNADTTASTMSALRKAHKGLYVTSDKVASKELAILNETSQLSILTDYDKQGKLTEESSTYISNFITHQSRNNKGQSVLVPTELSKQLGVKKVTELVKEVSEDIGKEYSKSNAILGQSSTSNKVAPSSKSVFNASDNIDQQITNIKARSNAMAKNKGLYDTSVDDPYVPPKEAIADLQDRVADIYSKGNEKIRGAFNALRANSDGHSSKVIQLLTDKVKNSRKGLAKSLSEAKLNRSKLKLTLTEKYKSLDSKYLKDSKEVSLQTKTIRNEYATEITGLKKKLLDGKNPTVSNKIKKLQIERDEKIQKITRDNLKGDKKSNEYFVKKKEVSEKFDRASQKANIQEAKDKGVLQDNISNVSKALELVRQGKTQEASRLKLSDDIKEIVSKGKNKESLTLLLDQLRNKQTTDYTAQLSDDIGNANSIPKLEKILDKLSDDIKSFGLDSGSSNTSLSQVQKSTRHLLVNKLQEMYVKSYNAFLKKGDTKNASLTLKRIVLRNLSYGQIQLAESAIPALQSRVQGYSALKLLENFILNGESEAIKKTARKIFSSRANVKKSVQTHNQFFKAQETSYLETAIKAVKEAEYDTSALKNIIIKGAIGE